MSEQLSFLSHAAEQAVRLSSYANRHPALDMTTAELTDWKQRVFRFQQTVMQDSTGQQGSLFDPMPTVSLADSVDPFTLPQQTMEFWRQTYSDSGVPAFYFVVDHELPLLLYVGETVKSNQRWKGEHDCKRYVLNYITVHRQHGLAVAVNIGFWPDAPSERQPRQQLERDLIYKWRSPFNKENWRYWNTPFVGGKSE